MEEHDRQSLYAFCTRETLSAGQVLFDYGELEKAVYFIEEGRLAVHKFTGFQEKMQVVALLDKGSIAGESAILEKYYHKTKVTAIEESVLFCLSADIYKTVVEEQPGLALRFLSYLLSITSVRLEKTSERLAQIL